MLLVGWAQAAVPTGKEAVLALRPVGEWRGSSFVAEAVYEAVYPCNDEEVCLESVELWFVAGLDGTARLYRRPMDPSVAPSRGAPLPDHARRAADAYPRVASLEEVAPQRYVPPGDQCRDLGRANWMDDQLELFVGGGHLPFFDHLEYAGGGDDPLPWRLATRPTDEGAPAATVAEGAIPPRVHMYYEPPYLLRQRFSVGDCALAVLAGTEEAWGFRGTRFHPDFTVQLTDRKTGRRLEVGPQTRSIQLLTLPGVAPAPYVAALRGLGWYGILTGEALAKRKGSVVYHRPEAADAAATLAAQLPGGATVEPLTWDAPTPLVVALGSAAPAP